MTSAEEKIAELERRVAELEKKQPSDSVCLIAFSGDLDRALSLFILATGAAALGQKVSIFFTFWGFNLLRKNKAYKEKNLAEKLMTLLAPSGINAVPLSKQHFFGAGTAMMKKMMQQKNIASPAELFQLAQSLGVQFIACETTRELMHVKKEELIEGLEAASVGAFLGEAFASKLTLFI